MNLTDLELGWIAGIMEGEGTFYINGTSRSLSIKMSDEDVIIRLALLFDQLTEKSCSIQTFIPKKVNEQQLYGIKLSGNNAVIVMKAIVKLMGFRRRKRIWQTLNGHRPRRGTADMSNVVSMIVARKAS